MVVTPSEMGKTDVIKNVKEPAEFRSFPVIDGLRLVGFLWTFQLHYFTTLFLLLGKEANHNYFLFPTLWVRFLDC